METSIETIDKERAQEYIAKIDGNRPISNGYIRWLIGRQRRDEWQTNGDSIKFDKNGVLRDGQHRLMMVMQTGMPIEVVVVREIDPAAFITMDTGKNRNLADVLAINKYDNSKPLASALTWVHRYLINLMYPLGGRITHEQHLDVLDKHPDLNESVAFHRNLQKLGRQYWTAITMACHYLFTRVDIAAANDFIERYVTGVGIDTLTDPVGVLRGQVPLEATRRVKPSSDQIFRIFALAWNAQRNEREQKQNFTVGKRSRFRPKIDGFPKELFLESQEELPLYSEETEEE
ncbi:MAG: hypothetical protein E3J46_07670 [Desulfobacteraceae bacterium]|nr:MAG: hypothetical protein E3J46_07670 [Desulfobacteraceae bacterium]